MVIIQSNNFYQHWASAREHCRHDDSDQSCRSSLTDLWPTLPRGKAHQIDADFDRLLWL